MGIKIMEKWPLIFLLFFLPHFGLAFCPPGCECNDQLLSVECDYAGLTSIPILLNPMLKSLTIRNSNGLKMDTFSIALYPELESLELMNNQIGQIPAQFLVPLTKLKHLNLRGNKLRRLEPKVFEKIVTLESLDLSSNQIDLLLPGPLDLLPNLFSLNISFNFLHSLPANPIFGAPKLCHLNLASNRLAKLPSNFANQSELEELNLAGNIVSELPSNAFLGCSKMRKLDLSANLISHIEEGAFNGFVELHDLNLAQNLLSTPFARIEGEESAGEGGQSQNWAKLPNKLERLDLSRNSWTQIPANVFIGAKSLKELLLEEMSQLREIKENAFADLFSLERLSLANSNFLHKIHSNAFGGQNAAKNLLHLDLANCQLSTISHQFLPNGQWEQRLKTLNLSGNRWNCECQLMAFLPPILEGLQKRQHQFVDNVLCAEPEFANGQSIVAVAKKNVHDFSKCPSSTTSIISSGQIFVQENFVWIASGAALLLMISSLVLLFLTLFCCCQKGGGGGKNHFCCRCPKRRENCMKRDQLGRVQLYSTGSTFTESLIYEKGPTFSASSSTAINNGITFPPMNSLNGAQTNRSTASKFYSFWAGMPAGNCQIENGISTNQRICVAQQKKLPSTSDESNETMENGQNVIHGGSNSNEGDEYYSSIMLDSPLYDGQYHHSPPDSPPLPPLPILLSDPPNWPPPNLLPLVSCCHQQMAAPPYQLRAAAKNGAVIFHGQPQCKNNVDSIYYGRNVDIDMERMRRDQQ